MSNSDASTTRDGQNVALVHEQLRSGILRGEIPTGEISQVALGRHLRAGRTPLREAIRMLQHEGLVISEPNRRVRVADLSAADAEDLSVMRICLEGMAIRLTVPALGGRDIGELEGLMAQMEHFRRIQDDTSYAIAHRLFHTRLISEGGERLTTLASQLFDHAERYRIAFAVRTPELWDARHAEHRVILDAVIAGQSDAAARCLVQHYGSSAMMIFDALGGDYTPDRLRTALASAAPGAERSLSRLSSDVGVEPGDPSQCVGSSTDEAGR